MNIVIFYHISKNLNNDGTFIPRVPEFRGEYEDSRTPRVSVAPTIEDCLTSIPMGGSNLDELIMEEGNEFKVYRIDTEKLGISKSDIVPARTLYKKDLVRDAVFTDEHWITVPFEVPKEDTCIIKVEDFDFESVDFVSYEIMKLGDEEYGGDFYEAFREVEGHEFYPCSIKIVDLSYRVKESKKEM